MVGCSELVRAAGQGERETLKEDDHSLDSLPGSLPGPGSGGGASSRASPD